ncbi:MAG: methyltransferase [Thermoanaerobaculia bacterium]
MEFKDLKKIIGSYWASRAIITAVELDIFTKIHRGINNIKDLARECKASIRGMEALITYLISIELIEEKERGLEISKEALFLSSLFPQNKLGWVNHQKNLFYRWCKLTEAVRKGRPVKDKFDLKSFILAMEQGKEIDPSVLKTLPLEEEFKLLDLGGGPGTYSVLFLENFPKSQVTLFDLPEVINFDKKVLPEKILKDKRFKMLKGDFLKDPLGKGYDYIWLSSVIHSYGKKEIEKLIKKCSESLNKKGKIFVLDYFLNDDKKGPPFSALFSLNMLVNTKNGKTYSFKEVEEILLKYGFSEFQRLPFQENNSVLIGTLL